MVIFLAHILTTFNILKQTTDGGVVMMMVAILEQSTVAIIGADVEGLTLCLRVAVVP